MLRYLGHLVGEVRMSVPEDRVTALAEWPLPYTKNQFKSFLGVVGYYRRFINEFTNHAAVLIPLTTREALEKNVWTSEGEEAFNVLKLSLCHCMCLTVPCPTDEFVLITDACAVTVGGCLHVLRDGVELPVGFFSRILRGAESRYLVSEEEALSIVACRDHFDVVLFGRPVVFSTVHRLNLALISGSSRSGEC